MIKNHDQGAGVIQWGTVVSGSETKVGIGVSGALRCALRVEGSIISAILKRGNSAEILAESFSAILLRGWGLPVPTPYLVNESEGIAFASAEQSYPNLSQKIGLDEIPPGSAAATAASRLAHKLVSQLPTAPLAIVADEAIANPDRNLGNILWDGVDEQWIDHAYAFATCPVPNKLTEMITDSGAHEAIRSAAIAHWLSVDRNSVGKACQAIPEELNAGNHAQFVSKQLSTLGNRILARFPQPDDLLTRS